MHTTAWFGTVSSRQPVRSSYVPAATLIMPAPPRGTRSATTNWIVRHGAFAVPHPGASVPVVATSYERGGTQTVIPPRLHRRSTCRLHLPGRPPAATQPWIVAPHACRHWRAWARLPATAGTAHTTRRTTTRRRRGMLATDGPGNLRVPSVGRRGRRTGGSAARGRGRHPPA